MERHSPEKSDRSLFLSSSELRWNRFQSMNIKLFPEDTFIFDCVLKDCHCSYGSRKKKKKVKYCIKKKIAVNVEGFFYHRYYSIFFVLNVMLDRIWAVTRFVVGNIETPTSTWQSLLCLSQGEVWATWTEKMCENPNYQERCKIVNAFILVSKLSIGHAAMVVFWLDFMCHSMKTLIFKDIREFLKSSPIERICSRVRIHCLETLTWINLCMCATALITKGMIGLVCAALLISWGKIW